MFIKINNIPVSIQSIGINPIKEFTVNDIFSGIIRWDLIVSSIPRLDKYLSDSKIFRLSYDERNELLKPLVENHFIFSVDYLAFPTDTKKERIFSKIYNTYESAQVALDHLLFEINGIYDNFPKIEI